MTRQHVSETNNRWVMCCDRLGCGTQSETFPTSPALELFRDRGWFIGWPSGDRCPDCLAQGFTSKAAPFRFLCKGESASCVPVDADVAETADEYGEVTL